MEVMISVQDGAAGSTDRLSLNLTVRAAMKAAVRAAVSAAVRPSL